MELNDLLTKQGLDPSTVLVLRHSPPESKLRNILPWFAEERPEMYNAYQQTQGPRVEKAMQKATHVVSLIGLESGTALFVGVYERGDARRISIAEYWKIEAFIEMRDKYGMSGFDDAAQDRQERDSILWFELAPTDAYADWKGRLVIDWPGRELSWWRWADRNVLSVQTIHEQSMLVPPMPPWDKIDLAWADLRDLPASWKAALREWRGIYYIFDESDGKGYVGAAYGRENLLGRWQNYAKRGHGDNKLLRERNSENFRFSILQRVSPDMDKDQVIRIEGTWKARLHTRDHGLNEN